MNVVFGLLLWNIFSPINYGKVKNLGTDLEDRHPRNDGVGIVLRRRVDRVIRPDDQRQVAVVEVVVNLLHLQH
jgi:hypothetical protein